jgi:hypothetical protein
MHETEMPEKSDEAKHLTQVAYKDSNPLLQLVKKICAIGNPSHPLCLMV